MMSNFEIVEVAGLLMVGRMDHDLAPFERDRRRRSHGRSPRDDFDDDDDDRRYRDERRRPAAYLRSYAKRRRASPHIFAWLLLGGGAVLLAAALMVIASSLGLWGALASGYFAVTSAILPQSWHDEWRALPGVAHLAMVLGSLFLAVGAMGEIFD